MICDGKGKIISDPEAGDNICIQAEVANGEAEKKSITMLAARYNNNGCFIGCSGASDMLQPGEKKDYILENIKLEDDFGKLKVYVWYAELLKPVWEIVQ